MRLFWVLLVLSDIKELSVTKNLFSESCWVIFLSENKRLQIKVLFGMLKYWRLKQKKKKKNQEKGRRSLTQETDLHLTYYSDVFIDSHVCTVQLNVSDPEYRYSPSSYAVFPPTSACQVPIFIQLVWLCWQVAGQFTNFKDTTFQLPQWQIRHSG